MLGCALLSLDVAWRQSLCRRRRLLLWLWLWLAALGQPARAQNVANKPAPAAVRLGDGKHCLGEQRQKLLLEQYMGISVGPLGIGHLLRPSLCTPLITKPGILFDLTNIEVGALLLNTPTSVSFGGFLNLVPLSFLVLRAEADVFYIWPIPLPGAGFISLNNSSEFKQEVLSPSPFGPTPATTATGGRILLGATLRGELPIGSRASIAVTNSINGEYWGVTAGTWADPARQGRTVFYVARRDLILSGPGDWALLNTAVLLAGVRLHSNVQLRLGITDDLVYVPSLHYLGNIVAGLVVLSFKNVFNLAKELAIFLRAGGYTHHAFRVDDGPTLALGFDLTYELFGRPWPRSAPSAVPAPDPTR